MAVESDLRQRIAKLLREHGFMVQAIETGAIGDGVPDLWYCKGEDGWLELKKVREMPKRPTTAVFKSMNHPLSTEQENWIGMCLEKGGRADILVGYGREYFFVPGKMADRFNDFTEADLRKYVINKQEIPQRLLMCL